MGKEEKEFEQELHINFLRSLHDEKIKTQSERATYITSKFAFITGLFSISALNVGEINFSTLLYIIPLVAIGYDLYIRAADLSIKKIGAFLRSDPKAGTAEVERNWERFSAENRDKLAQLATTLFSFIIIIGAAIFTYVQQDPMQHPTTKVWYPIWFLASLLVNGYLWKVHRDQVKELDKKMEQKISGGS